MRVADAVVSGSLGQAIFRQGDALAIIDGPEGEPRQPLPNEIRWLHHMAREIALVDPDGRPVSLGDVRDRLSSEIRFFEGLDGLLVGMDSDFSEGVRARAIRRAETVLTTDQDVARRVRHRFLIPASTQEWDLQGALNLAQRLGADGAAQCYRPLADGTLDLVLDEIRSIVHKRLGDGPKAADLIDAIKAAGLLAEVTLAVTSGDRNSLGNLLFRRQEFPEVRRRDPGDQVFAQVITALGKSIGGQAGSARETTEPDPDDEPALDETDPIVLAVEEALAAR
jgi:hypothetical protein